MLNEETYNKLIALQLHGLAAAFKAYLDQTHGRDELAFEERFGIFVDREWTERQQRRLANRLKSAKLREPACMEDVNYRHPRGLDRSVMQRLATCGWVKGHEAVIITGATGLGKTWLACALAHQACREGYVATYTRVPRLLHSLGLARADGSYVRELARLAKADVLILDDWALAPMGEVERRDMLEVLEDRHGLRSTIVTSQVPVAKWHDAIGDPTIADAILDRLVHRAHRLEMTGPSLRKAPRKGGTDE
ncbi:MAG: ATP-binding protein [Deltaproteobacteria bacterium]|nr:ATP-binding protein [Deltaproteobacteria bacterium]